jgi:hypothetical protein
VTKGIKASNQEMATEHKTKLEDGQRAGKKERDAEGSTWQPRLFVQVCVCARVWMGGQKGWWSWGCVSIFLSVSFSDFL